MTENAPPLIDREPPPRPQVLIVVAGFITGAVIWLIPWAMEKAALGQGLDGLLELLLACFVLPVVGVVLAIIRRTRPFGLGVLLACGIGWLVLGAMCGGLIS
jgi:hypothetical protein